MGEFEPNGIGQVPDRAPVAVFGGVLSVKRMLPVYEPLLASEPGSLPDAERFFPIPRVSLGEPAEMYKRFEEQIVKLYEKLGQRMVVVGQSLGGLAATMVGVEHPDKVAAVICLAGAQQGTRYNTPSVMAVNYLTGNHDRAKHVHYDSDFMQEHRQKIATKWSPDVALHLLSPTFDDLFPLPQGLGMQLPPGQAAQCYVVAPRWPGVHRLIRKVPNMPADVQILDSRFPTTHYNLQLSGAVIQHTQDVREVAVDGPLATVHEHPRLFDRGLPRRLELQLKASA